jgi:hypothetical protein
MADQALDLWPQIESVNVRTPGTILKQQAALLGKHTKNLIEGRVATRAHSGGFLHSFLIDVPTLDYTFELFAVANDLNLYPVRVDTLSRNFGVSSHAPLISEAEFVDWLKAVLNSAETKRILATLMAQAES